MGRTPALVVATVAMLAVLPLVACGGQRSGSVDNPRPAETFNDTDVAFAQHMIVHHQQAIMMAEMAENRAHDPMVRRLATEIAMKQQSEIETLTRLLRAWSQSVPTLTPGAMPRMPTPGPTPHMPRTTPMPDPSPMMDMRGAEFDHRFLRMMIAHHEAGIALAEAELADGINPTARRLAEHIETQQTAQIAQMRQLLATPAPTHS